MKWIPAMLLLSGCLSAQITVNDLLKCNKHTEIEHSEIEVAPKWIKYPVASGVAVGQEAWILWLARDEQGRIYVPTDIDVHKDRGEFRIIVGRNVTLSANIHIRRVASGFLIDCAYGATVSATDVGAFGDSIPVVGMFNSLEPKKGVGKK